MEEREKEYRIVGVVLFPEDEAIVREVMERLALSPRSGRSQAVRFIIRDWARLQAQTPEALQERGEGEMIGAARGGDRGR